MTITLDLTSLAIGLVGGAVGCWVFISILLTKYGW
jgi:hypothetical protein